MEYASHIWGGYILLSLKRWDLELLISLSLSVCLSLFFILLITLLNLFLALVKLNHYQCTDVITLETALLNSSCMLPPLRTVRVTFVFLRSLILSLSCSLALDVTTVFFLIHEFHLQSLE